MLQELRYRIAHRETSADRKRYKASFVKMEGNSGIRSASVVGIGELHEDTHHKKTVNYVIRRYARKGDIVLLESFPRRTKVTPDQHGYDLPPYVQVQGWEDPLLYDKAKKPMEVFDIIEKRWLNAINANDDVQASKLQPIVEALWSKLLPDTLFNRNQVLLDVINEVKPPRRRLRRQRKVFVVAGRDHFTDDPAFYTGLNKTRYVTYKIED